MRYIKILLHFYAKIWLCRQFIVLLQPKKELQNE